MKAIPAVAAVIVEDDRILLIKRGKEPSKGKWSVPGGSVEPGETLEEAVEREVYEETGLEIEIGDVAGVYGLRIERPTPNGQHPTSKGDEIKTGEEVSVAYHYRITDFFAVVTGGTLAAGDDADDARWVPLEEVDEYELTEYLLERLAEMGVLDGD